MGPGKLILVVEDNALARELMQAMLEEAGFRVPALRDRDRAGLRRRRP